jgi:hypothetical protein
MAAPPNGFFGWCIHPTEAAVAIATDMHTLLVLAALSACRFVFFWAIFLCTASIQQKSERDLPSAPLS